MTFNAAGGFNSIYGAIPSDPRAISDGSDMFLWLDPGDLVLGLVDSWPERALGNNAVQTGANRPTAMLSSALIGGRPFVRYDGSTSYMVGPLPPGVSQGDFHIFMVHRTRLNTVPVNAVIQTLLALGDPSSQSNGTPMIQWHNGITASTGQNLGITPYNLSGTALEHSFNGNIIGGKWLITSLSRVGGTNGNGGVLTLRTYGLGGNFLESVATQDWTSASSDKYCLGAQTTTTGFFTGDIAEGIGFSRGLNGVEHQYIIDYLRAKFLFQAPILELAGLMSLYRAGVGLFAADGKITAWNETGGFLAALNSSGVVGPAMVENDLAGYTTLLYDGIAARLLGPTSWTVAQPITIFVVLNLLSWIDGACIIGGHTGSGHLRVTQATSSGTIQLNAGSDGSYMDIPLNTYGVLCVVFNGADSTVYWNGEETSHKADVGSNTWDNIGFGAEGGASGSEFSSYKQGDSAVYQKALSATNVRAVTENFRNKFGI